jgi:hypothetical protein
MPNLTDDLMITTSYDDPDPEGVDTDGVLPLVAPYDDESEDDESSDDDASPPDTSQGFEIMGASKNKAEEEELEAEIEPGFRDIELPKGGKMEDDDPEGWDGLREDLEPGEAEKYLQYMRPLTTEEAELVEDPMFNDLRWVDDPAHIQDVLRAGKNERGVDKYLEDTTYGDALMKTEEELADRLDCDKLASWGDNFARRPATYVPARDRKKLALVREMSSALQCGHARYLKAADRAAGVNLRPDSYYMNVAGLWTQHKLRKNLVPTSPRANWRRITMPTLLGAAQTLLDETSGVRLFDSQSHSSMMGWGLSSLNPVKAIKSVGSKAYKAAKKTTGGTFSALYKYGVKMPTKYAYKYGVKMPTKYAYKGVKYAGKIAQDIALRPIRAIIRTFTSKMMNRRAAAIAKQAGRTIPSPADKSSALAWAKNLVRTKNSKYGAAIASLMGSDSTVIRPVDISFGDSTVIRPVDISFGTDEIGISKAGAAGLILLGPIGLIGVLTGLFKTKDAQQAAPPLPGEGEGFAPGEGEGEGEPGEGDMGPADEGPADEGPAEEYPTDEAGRTAWYRKPKPPSPASLAQITRKALDASKKAAERKAKLAELAAQRKANLEKYQQKQAEINRRRTELERQGLPKTKFPYAQMVGTARSLMSRYPNGIPENEYRKLHNLPTSGGQWKTVADKLIANGELKVVA